MKKFSAVCFGTWCIGCYGYNVGFCVDFFLKGVAEKSYSGFCSRNVALKVNRVKAYSAQIIETLFLAVLSHCEVSG